MSAAVADTGNADAMMLHQQMVEKLIKDGAIRSPLVEAAFRATPRHLFLPEETLDVAYANMAIPTKWIDGEAVSAASQPGIVASMLEQLELDAGQRVLEIGAGSGYNAALMAHITGEAGEVISVDIDEDIAAGAREHLLTAGFGRVQVVCADGREGYVDAAPFDRIILTVGATQIASAWHGQLARDGRLVLPLAVAGTMHRSMAFVPEDDHLVGVSSQPCQFMLLRPAAALPAGVVRLDPDGELTIRRYDGGVVSVEETRALLFGDSRLWSSDVRVTLDELVHGLGPWLDLHEPGFCLVHAHGAPARQGMVQSLLSGQIGRERDGLTGGWLEAGALCLLACPANRSPLYGGSPFTLSLRGHGEADALAQRLLAQIGAWDSAGRPSLEGAQVRVYPAATGYIPEANETAVVRGQMQLVVCWHRTLP